MSNVIVLADAADDLEQARAFYETQAPDLDDYCLTSVLADLASLASFGGIHSEHLGYHRMIGTIFPLGIYYRQRGEDTLVIAILDLRRNPRWIREQLHQRKTPNE